MLGRIFIRKDFTAVISSPCFIYLAGHGLRAAEPTVCTAASYHGRFGFTGILFSVFRPRAKGVHECFPGSVGALTSSQNFTCVTVTVPSVHFPQLPTSANGLRAEKCFPVPAAAQAGTPLFRPANASGY